MKELIRELIDATYDTGHYAGDGRSGTDLHRKRIEDRDVLRDKLETRLTAADALAEALGEILTDFFKEINYVYEDAAGRSIEQDYIEEIGKWWVALSQYREADRKESALKQAESILEDCKKEAGQ